MREGQSMRGGGQVRRGLDTTGERKIEVGDRVGAKGREGTTGQGRERQE